MITLDKKITSPFKFLDSYKKNDFQSYFGRDQESVDLFQLYKDSSLMILHGPSGSGKTSLIYCGLLNRIKTEKRVLSIRRDDDLINAIKKKLFINPNHESNALDDQSKLIDDFFSAQSELNQILSSINHIEGMMLKVEEEIIRLKRKSRETATTTRDLNNAPIEDQEGTQEVISKYKERLRKFISERKELLVRLREDNKQVTIISNNIRDYFMNSRIKGSKKPFTPLIIFDQFEELFVYGTKQEIDKFGLFLKLIFEYKIPFNIIISLREEYFGHLDQLQSFIPHIFYKKIRLAHPNKQVIKKIITKSFQEFNINQYNDDTNEELSDDEKENRIELILDQIKIKDNESTSYHLPFLQVYLDRLYKVDYYRTYGDKPSRDNDEYLPLEFKEEEIKEFGSIEQVLENYIREVNNKIIRNKSNKLNDRIEHKDSVIKFLRHFKTKDDLKKRVPIQTEKDNYYVINNRKISDKIQKDIWGEVNELEYNETISEIIDELKEKGILKVSTDQNLGADYAELSHDIIAKVISKIRTEDDFRLLIKKDFISSFDIYEDTQDTGDLLSTQQIDRMNQCLGFVMDDDNQERLKRKRDFFEKSVEESHREELEKKKLEKKLKRYVYYPFIITCLAIILAAQLKEGWKDSISIKIHEKMGESIRDYNVDRTSSFNSILACEDDLRNTKVFGKYRINLLDNKWFNFLDEYTLNLLADFKNDLYKDYSKTPFYQSSTSIDIGEGDIKSTKTRREDSILYIYALTKSEKLTLSWLEYEKKDNIFNETYVIDNNVSAFEPFKYRDKQMILVAKVTDKDYLKIVLLDKNGTQQYMNSNNDYEIIIKKKTPLKIDIEHKSDLSFIIGIDNEIHQLDLDLTKNENQPDVINLDYPIKKIKSLDNEHYLVLYGKSRLFINHKNISSNVLEQLLGLEESDEVHTFKIRKEDETLFLGLKGRIIEFNLKTRQKGIHYVHDEQINTIATNKKGEILVGSRDNGANLLSANNMLIKRFIGHTKPIHNVSFIKGDDNYIITSGEDQTIKLWNITPIEENVNSENKYFEKAPKDVLALDNQKTYLLEHLNKGTITSGSEYMDNIVDIDYSEDGEYAVSGSSDNTAIIWKQTESKYDTLKVLTSHTGDIIDVEFYENNLLLTASSDNTVQIYKRKKDKGQFIQIPSVIRHDDSLNAATFHDNGQYILSKDIKGNIKKWDFNKFDSIIKARTYRNPTKQY